LYLLLLAILLLPKPAVADDNVEAHSERFSIEGKYAIVASGVGMLDSSSSEITLDVPGQAIKAGYLYWSGFGSQDGGDDTVTLARDGGSATSITADSATGTYGPLHWWGENYYFAYVADVTKLVETGAHTYTVAGFEEGMTRRDGAGLMVVYEDSLQPYNRVQIKDGLDRFHRYWGEGPRAESAVNCFTFEADKAQRGLKMASFAGEIYMGGALRPNALWYKTGTAEEPQPTDMVSAPTNGPPTGNLLQGPPDSPFMSKDNPQWDTYVKRLTIPAGHTWVCLQVESARYKSQEPASGVWLANGITVRIEEPPQPPPTDTPTPTPTPTITPTPTDDWPKPPDPPPCCIPWLLVIPCLLAIGLFLLFTMVVRRRDFSE
jgi:hypothetical protein